MKGSIFEVLYSQAYQDDATVVCMSDIQRDGRLLVREIGAEDNNTRLIPFNNLKAYNSI